ncbi:Htur_1727 family rSAM-partnered candidate RiPP (plasmid) [Halobaculum sp. CBA1158]|uniref:Htur_1727 family rSAM-partnered candidate RiPP n=1 Tax=Halobaculum sp. CBA1158 TaxID=2904243 RepID=UPI001F491290|nr:Htur_1727 family rSAM-partnered candidate RiPP [Halobaculum sp. CBA1158]UIP01418.1 Htur_1727 family rSAM-partnered candidate RiPP [Halobaculum sp. CBA1158]
MTDSDRRESVAQARADDSPEWEVFLRESSAEPLRHAGSVTAPSTDVAREQASALFPEASTLWLARSDRVARFTERDLGAEYDGDGAEGDDDADADGERDADANAAADGGVEA